MRKIKTVNESRNEKTTKEMLIYFSDKIIQNQKFIKTT